VPLALSLQNSSEVCATLDITNVSQTIATLSSTDGQASKVLMDGGQLTVGDATTTTFDGAISGMGGSLINQGSGQLILSGPNTCNGGTTVISGSLVIANAASIQDGTSLSVGSSLSAFSASDAGVPMSAPTGGAGVTAVPEPGTLVLLAAALCGAGLYRCLSSREPVAGTERGSVGKECAFRRSDGKSLAGAPGSPSIAERP